VYSVKQKRAEFYCDVVGRLLLILLRPSSAEHGERKQRKKYKSPVLSCLLSLYVFLYSEKNQREKKDLEKTTNTLLW